jgi:NAD(P)H-flavin reductase
MIFRTTGVRKVALIADSSGVGQLLAVARELAESTHRHPRVDVLEQRRRETWGCGARSPAEWSPTRARC